MMCRGKGHPWIEYHLHARRRCVYEPTIYGLSAVSIFRFTVGVKNLPRPSALVRDCCFHVTGGAEFGL